MDSTLSNHSDWILIMALESSKEVSLSKILQKNKKNKKQCNLLILR